MGVIYWLLCCYELDGDENGVGLGEVKIPSREIDNEQQQLLSLDFLSFIIIISYKKLSGSTHTTFGLLILQSANCRFFFLFISIKSGLV